MTNEYGDLVIKAPAFNTDLIHKGNFMILYNRSGHNVICAGIVVDVHPMSIKLAIYDKDDNKEVYNEDYSIPGIKMYHVDIEKISEGSIGRIAIINPLTHGMESK